MPTTTPLEVAIRFADPSIVRRMRSKLPLRPEDADSKWFSIPWLADELREMITTLLLTDHGRLRGGGVYSILFEEVRFDVDLRIENNEGIQALQPVRQTMDYSGGDYLWKELVEAWGLMLLVDDDGIRERPKGPAVARAKFGVARN